MASALAILAKTVLILTFVLLLANVFWIYKLQKHSSRSDIQFPRLLPSSLDSQTKQMDENAIGTTTKDPDKHSVVSEEITIAAVSCGSRIEELLVMMKSALIFSSPIYIRFIIFADEQSSVKLKEEVQLWPQSVTERMRLDLHPIQLPENNKPDEWKKLFKPCSSQRLFLPSLLQDVDSLLYMDTDTVFLTSPHEVWKHFLLMNDSQMAAVAPEHEDYATGWYNRFARHPYYGNLGINSGVMLMNLTRMRSFGWEQYVIPIYHEYQSKITWGDQDIINIVFHFHPEKLYIYPCHYNFRPDHCMYMSVCKSAEENGIYILHGNRGSFHNDKQPAFQNMYRSINEFQFGSDLQSMLLLPMKKALEETVNTNCGRVNHIFTKAIENHITKMQNK